MVVLAALIGAALAALATPAQAAPQQPIMTLTRLSELIAASPSGTIPGCYFLTTDKGVDIATIKCTVDAVVPEAADDNGSLIMFDATDDPIIDAIGGIADGMSGSPLYVTDPANHTYGHPDHADHAYGRFGCRCASRADNGAGRCSECRVLDYVDWSDHVHPGTAAGPGRRVTAPHPPAGPVFSGDGAGQAHYQCRSLHRNGVNR